MIPSHFHKPPDGDRKIPVNRFPLRQIGDSLGGFGNIPSLKKDASGLDRKESGNAFQEGRFSRTIWSEDADAMSSFQRQIEMMNRRNAVVAHRQVLDAEKWLEHFLALIGITPA